jgi:hypothetical protein
MPHCVVSSKPEKRNLRNVATQQEYIFSQQEYMAKALWQCKQKGVSATQPAGQYALLVDLPVMDVPVADLPVQAMACT